MSHKLKSALLFGCLSASSAAAQEVEANSVVVQKSVTVGEDITKAIATNLDGKTVPADIGQIFIGNTADSADAITIDSGSNFPPGIAFRRYLGDPTAPQAVTAGTQLGYMDFRGYSGDQFFNAGSLDVVVDGAIPFSDGDLPPSQMRFAVSDGKRVYIPMELRANGRLELGALEDGQYFGPGLLGNPKFFVNTNQNAWGAILAARPAEGPAFALRLHTSGETAADYIIGGSSGPGSGSFKFSVRGNGDVHIGGDLFVGTRNVGAAIEELSSRILTSSVAIGLGARATSSNATAIGNDAAATGANALSLGSRTRTNGASAISLGSDAVASGQGNVAVGASATATATGSLAFGAGAKAIRDNAVAIGNGNLAQGVQAVAIGNAAVVVADKGTAIGAGANVRHENATAVGAGATTTAANQVMLGAKGTSVVVADIDASTAAQVGPVDAVTIDGTGTLGRRQVATQSSVDSVRVSMSYIAAVSEAQFSALSGRLSTLEGQVSALFDLTNTVDEDAQQGIAAVAAMAHPHFPSATGKTSYASNVAAYRGQVGFSAGVMHRFAGDFAVSGGVTYAGGDSTAVRVGVAGEF